MRSIGWHKSGTRIVQVASTELASPVRKQAWIGIASAIGLTLAKLVAWQVTGSVGFYSDMLESLTVAIGAVIALVAIRVSLLGPDARHAFGHAKAEYFASFLDSVLILSTSLLIFMSAFDRLRHPQPVENGWMGTTIAFGTCLFSLFFARQLFKAARKERSISLQAEARHLVVSACISFGVVIGVVLTLVTGWQRLDPILALGAGVAAMVTGLLILVDTLQGLMDSQIDPEPMAAVQRVLTADAASLGIEIEAIRTRTAGSEDFIEVAVAMPADWTISQAQKAIRHLERDLIALQPGRHVTIALTRGLPEDEAAVSTEPVMSAAT